MTYMKTGKTKKLASLLLNNQ